MFRPCRGGLKSRSALALLAVVPTIPLHVLEGPKADIAAKVLASAKWCGDAARHRAGWHWLSQPDCPLPGEHLLLSRGGYRNREPDAAPES